MYTDFTTLTCKQKVQLHFKGVEPLTFSLENQYSAIKLKMPKDQQSTELKGFEPFNARIKNGCLNHIGYSSKKVVVLKEKGFEPLKELYSSRFTVYRF